VADLQRKWQNDWVCAKLHGWTEDVLKIISDMAPKRDDRHTPSIKHHCSMFVHVHGPSERDYLNNWLSYPRGFPTVFDALLMGLPKSNMLGQSIPLFLFRRN